MRTECPLNPTTANPTTFYPPVIGGFDVRQKYAYRIAFYDAQFREGAAFKVIIRFAFALAHVLYGQKLSDKKLDEIKNLLLAESGKVKRIEYPDEKRDEFIADWLSRAVEPIQIQFEDFFYMGEFRRIPGKRPKNKPWPTTLP